MNLYLDFSLRLLLAGVMGTIIGLEREYRSKEAGYRTHFLVAVGSALMMIVSQYGFNDVLQTELVRLDPSRIAAQVVSGIGFIGAGTIILLHKQIVRGLTTAAGLWATSGIGLAIGAGMYTIGVIATMLVLVGLEVLNLLFKNLGARNMVVEYSTSNKDLLAKMTPGFSSKGFVIVSYNMEENVDVNGNIIYNVSMVIKARRLNEEGMLLLLLHDYPEITVHQII